MMNLTSSTAMYKQAEENARTLSQTEGPPSMIERKYKRSPTAQLPSLKTGSYEIPLYHPKAKDAVNTRYDTNFGQMIDKYMAQDRLMNTIMSHRQDIVKMRKVGLSSPRKRHKSTLPEHRKPVKANREYSIDEKQQGLIDRWRFSQWIHKQYSHDRK